MTLIIILGSIAVALAVLWFVIKPYTIKYDTTLAFTGGLGSGKTLNATKTAVVLWKKTKLKIKVLNFKSRIINKIKNKINKKRIKKGKEPLQLNKIYDIPCIYSNYPIKIDKKRNIWSRKLKKEHLLLQERITEYSIVVIDELPQLINQFNWNIKEVQNNVNEFITFFRHYIGGYFIITAQSIDDIVAQIRRKLNTYFWLFDFHKLFIFYKVRICSLQTSDMITSTTSTFIEDNTKWKYGIIWHKYYDSRCYSKRYDKVITENNKRFKKFKTNEVFRFSDYISPLDDKK
ncbi:MAG: zonular occludens toxin domain-containing protein [Candidatus Onthovivens sp.]|nr:zonular occludens toxin domain-containing protein [Candidatus Onthovivens sp.]